MHGSSVRIVQHNMKSRILILVLLLTIGLIPLTAQDDAMADEPIITREAPPSADNMQLVPLVNDLRRPLFIVDAPDELDVLFILEQGGIIKAFDRTNSTVTPFLDISELVTWDANTEAYTERGLLGMAFAPDYADSGRFFINYTDRQGRTIISRFLVSDDPLVADATSENIIFTLDQPFPNHNGGHMEFGMDGYLYVSVGDGGAANDPLGAGQNPNLLLGSILRLDVSDDAGYTIPEDNPFVNGGGLPEIWAWGLRNVWRFSHDMATGDMYIADVGQNQYEEINFQPAGMGGWNYGWNQFEGNNTFTSAADPVGKVMPVVEYSHSEGCSVTGGYVYRGEAIPDLQGVYLFSDYCTGTVWYAYRDTGMNWVSSVYTETGMPVSSFGQDQNGEMFIIDYMGTVYSFMAQ